MLSFPPFPVWEAAHPALVHVPMGLALIAPFLIALGVVFASRRRTWFGAALCAMAVATVFAFLAVLSGEAAAEIAPKTPVVHAAIEEHEELAELYRTVLLILTIVFIPITLGAPEGKKNAREQRLGKAFWPAFLVFAIAYLWSMLLVANAAHLGGELVHIHGVLAPVSRNAPATLAPDHGDEDHEDDDD